MKKILFFLILLVLFFPLFVLAAPFPPQAECIIKAKIIETNVVYSPFNTRWALKIFNQRDTTPTPGWTKIKIINVEKEAFLDYGYSKEDYCIKQYKEGKEIILRPEKKYKKGTIISGIIQLAGDEYGSWYFIKNEELIEGGIFEEEKEKKSTKFFMVGIFPATIGLFVVLYLFLCLIKKKRKTEKHFYKNNH